MFKINKCWCLLFAFCLESLGAAKSCVCTKERQRSPLIKDQWDSHLIKGFEKLKDLWWTASPPTLGQLGIQGMLIVHGKGDQDPTTTIAAFTGVPSVFFTKFSQIRPVWTDLNNDKYCNLLLLQTDSLFRDVHCAIWDTGIKAAFLEYLDFKLHFFPLAVIQYSQYLNCSEAYKHKRI